MFILIGVVDALLVAILLSSSSVINLMLVIKTIGADANHFVGAGEGFFGNWIWSLEFAGVLLGNLHCRSLSQNRW